MVFRYLDRQHVIVADPGECLVILNQPFVFSQSGPLSSRNFVDQARRLGLRLDHTKLAALHRSGDLSPLVALTESSIRPGGVEVDEPAPSSTLLVRLRIGQLEGRVFDPARSAPPHGEPLEFREAGIEDPRGWWNGLLYSRWQLLSVHRLRHLDWTHVAEEGAWGSENQAGFRDRALALALTLLEPRYLPEAEPGWLRVSGFDLDAWFAWREAYDPSAAAELLESVGVPLERVLQFAESLLVSAHTGDPSGQWAALIHRAPVDKWKSTSRDLALALEQRLAAEILLRFYEDASGSLVRPDPDSTFWKPWHDRISDRSEPIGELLMRLGVPAYATAAVVLEGETEELLASRVLGELDLNGGRDLIQVVCMRGIDKDLELLTVAIAGPILGARRGDAYLLRKPPCHLFVAVDPEKKFATEVQVEGRRSALVNSIIESLLAQRADADVSFVDRLVNLRTWDGGTFEFAHFTDAEIGYAIELVHTEPAARESGEDLLSKIASARARGLDVKDVWHDWNRQPSKKELADALWPAMREKIRCSRLGRGPLPQLAQVITLAHRAALRHSQGIWQVPVRADEP